MTVQCTPMMYGGYDQANTIYNDVSLSTFNIILVETSSNDKNPRSSKCGIETSRLNAPFHFDSNFNNKYATKHICTALAMAIDTQEPYAEIQKYQGKNFIQEFKPLKVLTPRWCKRQRNRVKAKISQNNPKVWWTAGGSFMVDETFLLYGK